MTAPGIVPSVLDLIGNTPLVRVRNLDCGPCELYLKLESQNPGGSIKDRIALSMITAAEKAGRLKPGGLLVEATAGNTGLGLALLANLKGYRVILVVPDKMSREKIQHCRALGADVRITRSDVGIGHPDYYQDMARRIAGEENGFYVDQFGNPANPAAHETGTGPELWAQMDGRIDAVVCGVGSGGTMAGLARFFKTQSAATQLILADPAGSILAPLVNTGEKTEAGSWLVEGIGEDFVPPNLDISVIARAYAVSDADSFAHARDLLLKEGILAGASSGTLLAAALRYCREQKEKKRVVTFVCDRGDKYLSKGFSDPWLKEQGLVEDAGARSVGDLIMRQHGRGETVFVRPTDNLATAYKRMRMVDVSQLPVLSDADHIDGVIDEDALFNALRDGVHGITAPVSVLMRRDFVSVPSQLPLSDATRLFGLHGALMVVDDGHFRGVVTRVDCLNHFFLKEQHHD